MKNKTSQSGFTLIELIAVMVILGILAAVIIPRISTITSGAYESNVRNMYGLIKNEVTAQAVKAAMTGDFLETFPEPAVACTGCPAVGDMDAEHYYLNTWVGDFDPESWSSFSKPALYDNSQSGAGRTGGVLFVYHPHGRPPGDLTWTDQGAFDDTFGGDAGNTSLEDLYFIMYAPRTSANGKLRGRTNDGYVMAAWKNMDLALTFDGIIDKLGATADNGDDPLPDLTMLYEPN